MNIFTDGAINITRLTQPYSRRALRRRNLVYFTWRYIANGIRTGRALLTRRSHIDSGDIERDLKKQGIVVGPSARFLTTVGQKALEQVGARILQTSRSIDCEGPHTKGKKEFLVDLVSYPEGMSPDDPLLRVALDRKLLEIVSGYFGMWPCLNSVGAWLNRPTDAPPQFSQLWHRDPGDLKVIKVFIYLTNVDEQCGPFSYIPGTQPFGTANNGTRKLERKKRVRDDLMARFHPPECWRICTGQAGTMILADTVGYHRGGKPMNGQQRILITFTYTSATPVTASALWVRSMPEWASRIQQSAVKLLVTGSPGSQ